MSADWEHWQEWRRVCALDRCDGAARQALLAFGGMRYQRYASAYVGMTNLDRAQTLMIPDTDAWHALESSMQVRRTRQGKAYKHWVFARGSPASADKALGRIEGGISMLMRDVVRERLRREIARRGTVSLDFPWPGAPANAPTLRDLLPAAEDPLAAVHGGELERQALELAEPMLAGTGLSHRAKVAILALDAGCSLAHPGVLKAAGCGKSVLYSACHQALQAIADAVNRYARGEDRATRAELAIATLQAIKKMLHTWAASEKRVADFFNTLKEATEA